MGKGGNGNGKPADGGSSQKAEVAEGMTCPTSAVLHTGDRHTQTSLKRNVRAAMAYAVKKARVFVK